MMKEAIAHGRYENSESNHNTATKTEMVAPALPSAPSPSNVMVSEDVSKINEVQSCNQSGHQ